MLDVDSDAIEKRLGDDVLTESKEILCGGGTGSGIFDIGGVVVFTYFSDELFVAREGAA